jgi:RHS repeat-associated protein
VSGQPSYFTANTMDNRFLFKGSIFIPQAETYDMRNRFHHPNLGRFMQTDPIGFDAGDMNLFRYCGDDPVDRTDRL